MLGETDYTPTTLVVDAVRHLIRQGRLGSQDNRGCVYIAPDGTKCAIGGLIPDDKIGPEMNNWSLERVLQAAIGPEAASRLLLAAEGIQSLHDLATGPVFLGTMRRSVEDLDRSAPGWREALAEAELDAFFEILGYTRQELLA